MVFVDSSGQIHQTEPWSVSSVRNFVWSFINGVILFFSSLVGFNASPANSNGKRGGRGGSGGSYGPGDDKPSKRFFTMRDINPPKVGGCAGGSCGMFR